MRRSARLRSVMSRSTKIWPWNAGSGLEIDEALTDTGMVWPRAVPTTVSPGSPSTRSTENAGACASAISESNCAPVSSAAVRPSNSVAAVLTVRIRPSGAVTSTASLMLFSTAPR